MPDFELVYGKLEEIRMALSAIDTKVTVQGITLTSVESQVKQTNGRVTVLETKDNSRLIREERLAAVADALEQKSRTANDRRIPVTKRQVGAVMALVLTLAGAVIAGVVNHYVGAF